MRTSWILSLVVGLVLGLTGCGFQQTDGHNKKRKGGIGFFWEEEGQSQTTRLLGKGAVENATVSNQKFDDNQTSTKLSEIEKRSDIMQSFLSRRKDQ